jgi:hypothetical protein
MSQKGSSQCDVRQTGGWRADARFLSSSKRKVNRRPTVSRCPFLPILPLRAFVLPGVLGERGREENRGSALPVLQRAQREGGVRWYITSTIVTTRSAKEQMILAVAACRGGRASHQRHPPVGGAGVGGAPRRLRGICRRVRPWQVPLYWGRSLIRVYREGFLYARILAYFISDELQVAVTLDAPSSTASPFLRDRGSLPSCCMGPALAARTLMAAVGWRCSAW